jgi:hypothetical protein
MYGGIVASISLVLLTTSLPKPSSAQQGPAPGVQDPICGVWTMDTTRGETYVYVLTVRPNGTVGNRLMREDFEGTWKRLKSGRYIMSPGGDDDYVVLRNGRLEEWDKTGFIRSFDRVRAGGDVTNGTDLAHAAKLRREAQSWMYATFTPGMWWKASTIRDFAKHAGTYSVSKAHPPYHRAFYFALPDMTVLVDDQRGVAMTLRDGRAIE